MRDDEPSCIARIRQPIGTHQRPLCFQLLLSSWCFFLSLGSLLGLGSLLSLACSTLRLCFGSLFSLLGCGLLVGLLSLALLQTLCDGIAAGGEDHLYGILCVVVGRDDVVDVLRVRVGVDDAEYRNPQTVGLLDGDVLLHDVYYEEGRRQAGQVGDGTEVLLQLGALAGDLQQLSLGEVGECSVVHQLVDVRHFLHCLTDCREVGQHTAGPTLVDVWHVYRCGLLGYSFLSLFFSSDEQDLLSASGKSLERLCSLVNLGYSLVKIDDVDAVALHEDVGRHSGVPLTLEVTEVAAGLKKGFKISSRHFEIRLFTFLEVAVHSTQSQMEKAR